MADFRTFEDFDSKMSNEWTMDIDTSKLSRVDDELKRLIFTTKRFKESLEESLDVNASISEVTQALQELQNNIELIQTREAQLMKSRKQYGDLSRTTSGDESHEFAAKAVLAEKYAHQLREILELYKYIRVETEQGTKNGVKAKISPAESPAVKRAKEAKPPEIKPSAPKAESAEANAIVEQISNNRHKDTAVINDTIDVDTTPAEEKVESLKNSVQEFSEEVKEAGETVAQSVAAQVEAEAQETPQQNDPSEEEKAKAWQEGLKKHEEALKAHNERMQELGSVKAEAGAPEIDSLDENIKELEEDIKQAQADLDALMSDKASGKADDNADEEIEYLQNYIAEAKERIEVAKQERASIEDVASARAENAVTDKAPEKQDTVVQETQPPVSNAESLSEDETRLEELRAKAQALKAEVAELRAVVFDEDWSKEFSKASLAGDEAKLQDLYDDIAEVKKEWIEKRDAYENLTQEIRALEAKTGQRATAETPESAEALQQKEAFEQRLKEREEAALEEARRAKAEEQERRARERAKPAVSQDTEQTKGDEQAVLTYEKLTKTIARIKGDIAEMRESAQNGGDVNELASQIKEAEAELKKYETLKKSIDGQEKKQTPEKKEEPQTRNLITALREMVGLRMQLAGQRVSLLGTGDVDGTLAKIRTTESELWKVNHIVKQLGELGFAKAIGTGFDNLKKSLSNVAASAKKTLSNLGSAAWNGIKQGAASAASAVQNLASRGFSALRSAASGLLSGLANLASKGFNAVKTAASGLASGVGNLASRGFAGLKGAIGSAASVMGNLASKGLNRLKTGFNAAKNGIVGMGRQITTFTRRHTPNMLKSLNGIKSMLMRRVKRTFISAIFNQAKNGMQQLAKYSAEFNTSMSMIKNASKETAGNLSVTMGNLVNMIAPALNAVLSVVTQVIQAINALFAALTGKGTFTVAKKSTDNYAKSLKGAGGAAKDLNHQLYGFDELTRQEDDSGGGGGGAGNIKYEKKSVADFLDEELKAFVEALKNERWKQAGEILGKYLSGYVKLLDDALLNWRSVAEKWAGVAAQFANGLVAGANWELIGKTIGDGINLIFGTVNKFLEEFDFRALGEGFGRKFVGLIDAIDFDLLGRVFANGFNAVFATLAGLVDKFPWKKAGLRLSNAVASFFQNINWKDARDAFVGGINGIIDMGTEFGSNVPYETIAKNIFANLSTAIRGIKWDGLGKLLGNGINHIFTIYREFVNSDVLESLGNGIFTALQSAISTIDFEAIGSLLQNRVGKLSGILTNVIGSIDFADVARKFARGINSIFDHGHISNMFESVGLVIADGSDALITLFDNLTDPVHGIHFKKIGQEIGAGIGSLFDKVNWTGLGKVLGKNFNGLLRGLSGFIQSFPWKNVARSLGNAITALFLEINWSNVGETLSNGLNSLVDAFAEFAGSIPFASIADRIFKGISEMIRGINWSSLGNIFSNSINIFTEILQKFVDGDVITEFGKGLGQGFASAFGNIDYDASAKLLQTGLSKLTIAFANFIEEINLPDIASKITSGINTFFDTENGGGAFDTAVAALSGGIDKAIEAFGRIVDPKDGIQFENIGKIIGQKAGNLLNGIDWTALVRNILFGGLRLTAGFASFLTNLNLEGIAAQISSGVNSFFKSEDGTSLLTTLAGSVGEGIHSIIDTFSTFVTDLNIETISEEIGKSVNTLLSKIDWGKLVNTVLLGFVRISLGFFRGLSQINFADIAKQIANGVNSFFNPESGGADFGAVAKAASDGINNIISAIKGLITGENAIDFANIGESLKKGVSTLLSETDFEGLVEAIGKGVLNATNAMLKLATGIFEPAEEGGETLGQRLAKGINNIFRDENGALDLSAFESLGQSIGDIFKGIFTNLTNFFQETDWEAIGESILTAIANIDWLGIGTSIIEFLGSAITAALSLADGLIGKALQKLLGLPEQTSEFNGKGRAWAEASAEGAEKALTSGNARTRIIKTAANLANSLVNNDTLMSADQKGTELAKWFAGGIAKGSPEAVRNAFIHANIPIDEALAQSIANSPNAGNLTEQAVYEVISSAANPQDLRQKMSELLGDVDIGYDLANKLYGAKVPVAVAANDLMYSLQTSFSASDVKTAFANAGIEITDALAESLKGQGKENLAAALTLMGQGVGDNVIAALDMNKLSENLDAFMDATGVSLQDVAKLLMANSADELYTIADGMGENVGANLGLIIPQAMIQALAEGEAAVNEKKDEVVEKASASQQDVTNAESNNTKLGQAAQKTTEAITAEQENVSTASQGVVTSIEDPLSKVPDEVKPYAEQMMTYLLEGITNGDPLIQTAIDSAATAVVAKAEEILSSTKGLEIAQGFMSGMQSGIESNSGTLVTLVTNTAQQAVAFANSRLNMGNGYSLGSNLIIGMINGTSAYGQMLVNKVTEICQAVIDTARGAFDVHSPSRVFEQIGAYVMEGMGAGLDASAQDTINTMSQIADAIISEASEAGNVQTSVDVMSNGLDDVASEMSRIAEIFSAIADTITEMGGFEVPTVASGKVLPYRAKVGDEPQIVETNNVMSDRNSLEDAIYAAFNRAMENNQNEQNVKVYLDGRELTDAVTKYQRQQQRAWGV